MQSAIRSYNDLPVSRTGHSLFDIAQTLGVPVVVANYRGADGMQNHATFGLDMGINWALFANAINQLCATGAVIIANVEGHEQLGKWVEPLLKNDIRFFVGVPLRDYQARRVGCIAVLASQAFVARRGVSVSRLGQLGQQFAGVSL